MFTLTITYRRGEVETRKFAGSREAFEAFETARGNAMVRDLSITNGLGVEIASYAA